jgi:hypothetical protein
MTSVPPVLPANPTDQDQVVSHYIDHAKVELMHCLADGLFRPLQKGMREKMPLNVSIQMPKYGVTLWWRNYALLGIDDQSIFLALHRIFIQRRETLSPEPQSQHAKKLRALLHTRYQAAELDASMVTTSLSEIARVAGLTHSGPNVRAVASSLLRLSGVDFVVHNTGDPTKAAYQTKLMSHFAIENGNVCIALNPMLLHAILGSRNAYVDMQHQRSLSNDAAKRLHLWLSGWANEGRTQYISLDKLVAHVWGDDQPTYLRKRRLLLRKAIREVAALPGWTCFEDDAGKVHVVKPVFQAAHPRSESTPPALFAWQDDTQHTIENP